jgi:2-dehydro-3-deoxyphosphogluconate aldolase/(4S)-4-hydroxy-2-oxoglutarate aldolase
MNSQDVYEQIAAGRLMAGMRGEFPPDVALKVVEMLLEYDMRVFEFTMNSTTPIDTMQAVKRRFGDDVVVGMGTVLSVADARRVLDAGADFIVSPAFQPEVVETVLEAETFIAPGVMTPSEAVQAWSMGVKLLKLFPMGTLGVGHFKAMFGPLNHMNFMVNGGMTAENALAFLQAGAVACGMAGWLTGNGAMSEETMHQRARELREAVRVSRGERPII